MNHWRHWELLRIRRTLGNDEREMPGDWRPMLLFFFSVDRAQNDHIKYYSTYKSLLNRVVTLLWLKFNLFVCFCTRMTKIRDSIIVEPWERLAISLHHGFMILRENIWEMMGIGTLLLCLVRTRATLLISLDREEVGEIWRIRKIALSWTFGYYANK